MSLSVRRRDFFGRPKCVFIDINSYVVQYVLSEIIYWFKYFKTSWNFDGAKHYYLLMVFYMYFKVYIYFVLSLYLRLIDTVKFAKKRQVLQRKKNLQYSVK